MRTPARWFITILRISGGGALLLGLAFWAGYARSLLQLHMVLGIVLVVSLWLLAANAWRNRARAGLVAFAIGWGLLTWGLGGTQNWLLPGSFHWVVQLIHLLVGMSAFAIGQVLARAAPPGGTPPTQSA
jgi:hypothetical protein